MANKILTNSIILKETMVMLANELGFTKLVTRKYSDAFAKGGGKIGRTVSIQKPTRYVVSKGKRLVIQDHVEEFVDVTIDQQAQIGLKFGSAERTLDLDRFSDVVIKPAVMALANQIDRDGLTLVRDVPNFVGDPTKIADQSKVYLAAKAKLESEGAPMDSKRAVVVGPYTQAGLVENLKGLFQSAEKISDQYDTGNMGIALGFKFHLDQNVISHTFGSGVNDTVIVSGANQSGTTLTISGLTNQLVDGDMFTIQGVYAINPQSRESIGQLRQFTVTSTTTNGATSLNISPALVGPAANGDKQQYQNVNSLPANGAALNLLGNPGDVVELDVAFHRDAFALVTVDMDLPAGTVDSKYAAARSVSEDLGISLRIITDYDIIEDDWVTRIDCLYGWALVYPELAVKIISRPDLF